MKIKFKQMKTVILTPDIQSNQSIGVHTKQLYSFLRQNTQEDEKVQIVAISGNDVPNPMTYRRNSLSDYIKAAEFINAQFDVCVLQYANGIYGGEDGINILCLANLLKVPLITIIHSVQSDPSIREKEIVGSLADKSACVLTFSQLGVEFLEHYYKIGRDNILRSNIGVTAFSPLTVDDRNALLGTNSSKLIMTCVDLDRGCGFETLINALPSVLKSNADTTILIVNTGEQNTMEEVHTKSLLRLAMQRGVLHAVRILHVSAIESDLERLMHAADVYVSTCIDEKKLEDVFLSLAINSGAAVLSTPTWFAKELLDEQKGIFYSFGSVSELSTELNAMLRNTNETQLYRENATLHGVQNSRELIARKMGDLLNRVAQSEPKATKEAFNPAVYPDLNLQFIDSLSYQIGYIQQSMFGVPDLKTGLTVHGNAMALEVFVKAYNSTLNENYLLAAKRCLGFIQLLQTEGGDWNASTSCFGVQNEGDSDVVMGQLICSLGTFYAAVHELGVKNMAFDMIAGIVSKCEPKSTKAMALGICGLAKVLQNDQGNSEMVAAFKRWSQTIKGLFPSDAYNQWQWCDDVVGQSMGLVPYALLSAFELLKDDELLSVAKRSLRFLEKHQMSDNRFSLKALGVAKNKELSKKIDEFNSAEVVWFTNTYAKLFELTKDVRYSKKALASHNWYLGDNALGKNVFDINTGGCYKAIAGRSLNPLMTLDATCAYWLSHFTIQDLYFSQLI